jgi:hypothetical protein
MIITSSIIGGGLCFNLGKGAKNIEMATDS